MEDHFGFEVEPNDFVLVATGYRRFLECRVEKVFRDAISVTFCSVDGTLQNTTFTSGFTKITSPTIEERLKERFWKFEGNRPWETNG